RAPAGRCCKPKEQTMTAASTTTYAVVLRPGFRDHEMRILSAHKTADDAARAAALHNYTNSRHRTVQPCEVVHVPAGCRNGGVLWDDACGRTAWSAI
ncbi:MAG: hypothetical protein ACRC8U_01585, partial [Brooklawnia sp.]